MMKLGFWRDAHTGITYLLDQFGQQRPLYAYPSVAVPFTSPSHSWDNQLLSLGIRLPGFHLDEPLQQLIRVHQGLLPIADVDYASLLPEEQLPLTRYLTATQLPHLLTREGQLRVCQPVTVSEWVDLDVVIASYRTLAPYLITIEDKYALRRILAPDALLETLLDHPVLSALPHEDDELTPAEVILQGLLLGHPLEATSTRIADYTSPGSVMTPKPDAPLYPISPEASWTYDGTQRCGAYYNPESGSVYVINRDCVLDLIGPHPSRIMENVANEVEQLEDDDALEALRRQHPEYRWEYADERVGEGTAGEEGKGTACESTGEEREDDIPPPIRYSAYTPPPPLPYTSPLLNWRNFLYTSGVCTSSGMVLNGIHDPSPIEDVLQGRKPLAVHAVSEGVYQALLPQLESSSNTVYTHTEMDDGSHGISVALDATVGELFDVPRLLDTYEQLMPVTFTPPTRRKIIVKLLKPTLHVSRVELYSRRRPAIVSTIVTHLALGFPLEVTVETVMRLIVAQDRAYTLRSGYLI
jgi:hypothetical protein